MITLTADVFEKLLNRLDGDPVVAADKYELLRMKVVKFLHWKGCSESEADALADTALDRLAVKIGGGEEVRNINAYACEISRLVWLEHLRRRKEEAVGDDKMPEAVSPAQSAEEMLNEPDIRLRCLRRCLAGFGDDDRLLICGYYDIEAGDKLKNIRKDLADRLELSMNTLKVKACRLRDRLEKCINECVGKLTVTKTAFPVTNERGGGIA